MRKKIIAFMLIAVILINSTIPHLVYAESQGMLGSAVSTSKELEEYFNKNGNNTIDNVFNNGTANVNSDNGKRVEDIRITQTSSSKVAQILADLFNIFPSLINFFMTSIIKIFQTEKIMKTGEQLYVRGVPTEEYVTKKVKIEYFTIEDIIFNRYYLFDIDYFDFTSKGKDNTLITIKKNVSIWYYAMRNIAIVANLITLIYIGIRLAISTVAEEQSKYKNMLYSWATSMAIIFFMHYIIAILYSLQDLILGILDKFVAGEGFEEAILKDTWGAINNAKGWDGVSVVITIYVIVYYELKFFLMYLKRLFTVGFLITVSPLITISYAIDAAGDGKTQVFNRWLKEMIFNIFIQVIHAVIYAIFIMSAAEIAKQIPILGAVLFSTLSRAVRIIRTSLQIDSSFTKSESLLSKFKKK